MTEAERKELLPSGRQGRFANRVAWARGYLKAAGLLQSPNRGQFEITESGMTVLAEKPERIDIRYLRRFPQFEAFRARTNQDADETAQEASPSQTPEELLETSYQAIRKSLAEDLLQRVRKADPQFFERIVVDLLVAMGYGGSRADAGQAVGKAGDDGVDGIIKEDRLGLDVVYVQAKRWNGPVGRPIVQAFAGSLEGQRARKGVLITTSDFSRDAQEYVQRIEKKIVLMNGQQLAQFMIDHGVGVTDTATYVVKKVDSDYFSEPE